MSSSAQQIIQTLLDPADIRLNGSRPWDLQIHDERTYARTLGFGSLGFGESYMDGWWDCEAIDQMMTRLFDARIDARVVNWRVGLFALKSRLLNAQRRSKAFEIGQRHYDAGNDLYRLMLDQRLTYTCGYWEKATTLDEAQEAKL